MTDMKPSNADVQVRATMPCHAWLSSIIFKDDTVLDLEKDDVVVLVGANNTGKSKTLRAVSEFATAESALSPVVKKIIFSKSGDQEKLVEWITQNLAQSGQFPNYVYQGYGTTFGISSVPQIWSSAVLGNLTELFIQSCRTDNRFSESNSPNAISRREQKSHPLHSLYDDDSLEKRISEKFSDAFGADFVVNWRGGNQIPLHVGTRPNRSASSDRVSNEYCDAVAALPLLSDQGDGMRAFASLLFSLESQRASILLIDEPEAFLHPPQARRMGELIAQAHSSKRQVIVATHSTDVLRGILSAGGVKTKVVRLSRDGGQSTRILKPADISTLWSDPILRFSNALDGLFHDATVLCEADADCRFYEAIINANAGLQKSAFDLHFAYTAGKDRLPVVQKALKTLGVTVFVVADFDILQNDKPLFDLVSSDKWALILKKIQAIRSAIDGKLPTLSPSAFVQKVTDLLGRSESKTISDTERDQIKDWMKGTSLWSIAKTQGKLWLSGDLVTNAESLFKELRSSGIFVVPVGEIESFCRKIGGHGPKWVAEVLKLDLKNDVSLSEARAFANEILSQLLVT